MKKCKMLPFVFLTILQFFSEVQTISRALMSNVTFTEYFSVSRLNLELDLHGSQLLAAEIDRHLQPDHRIRFESLCILWRRRSQRRISDGNIQAGEFVLQSIPGIFYMVTADIFCTEDTVHVTVNITGLYAVGKGGAVRLVAAAVALPDTVIHIGIVVVDCYNNGILQGFFHTGGNDIQPKKLHHAAQDNHKCQRNGYHQREAIPSLIPENVS
ncbi:hypothetical protein CKR_3428 [Clostridium kluyveri NBRC 12016]|uniref:Uncharacterized protein n=1 Tax=Clostridium kluyveri (strain NBRC 12016) TaxID=583346 RepID=B9DXN6_CLOK1|nr:hypothetical protein CKR_3428 [Clostridium kluyveri NBRC 12016]